MMYIRSHYKTR